MREIKTKRKKTTVQQTQLRLESLESRSMLTIMLFDDFISSPLDPAVWDVVEGTTIDSGALNPISAPFAARFNGNINGGDELRSTVINLNEFQSATLSYAYQRTGSGSEPIEGEDLILEVKIDDGQWQEVDRRLAVGPDQSFFTTRNIILPASVLHSNFQFRFRHLGSRDQLGDWYIDDIKLSTGLGQIEGRLWHDLNSNRLIDIDEPLLVGWTVFDDLNDNGLLDQDEPTAITDELGQYVLPNLEPTVHRIQTITPLGWQAISPGGGLLSLSQEIVDDQNNIDGLDGVWAMDISADDQFVYSVAAGDQTLTVWQRDLTTGNLTLVDQIQHQDSAVDGLRLLRDVAVSPDGKHVYTADALDNSIGVFISDPITGELTATDVVVNGIGGVAGLGFVSDLEISSDGLFLYAAGTNDNAIAVFSRDTSSGLLTFIQVIDDSTVGVSGIRGPTNLLISPDGNHLYVSAANDKAVTWFSRDQLSGELTFQNSLVDDTNLSDGLNGLFSMASSNDGNYLYFAASFDDSLTVYAKDPTTGDLSFVQMLRDGIDELDGLDGAYSVIVSADDRHVFVTSLVDHSLLSLSRDLTTGRLTPLELYSDGLNGLDHLATPRTVIGSNDSNFLIVGASLDDSLTVLDTQNSIHQISLNNAQVIETVDFGLLKVASVWDGGGEDNLWSNPMNWAGDVVAEAGDRLIFAGNVNLAVENDFPENTIFESLEIQSAGFTLSGNALILSSTIDSLVMNAEGSSSISLPILFQNGEIRLTDGSLSLDEIDNGGFDLLLNVGDENSLTISGEISGAGDLTKSGIGIAELAGENTYTGNTTVDRGPLNITGSIDVVSQITVKDQALLGNAENIAGTVTLELGGQLGSINEMNTMNLGGLVMQAGSLFDLDIKGNIAGSQFDLLIVNGSVQLQDSLLNINFDYEPFGGDVLTIIQNDEVDPIVGTFAGLPEGAIVTAGNHRFEISYQGGDGNDVELRLITTGEISGTVWYDANEDGVFDDDETTLSGWFVYLDENENGEFDEGELSAVSDESGNYQFTNLVPNQYHINLLEQPGWQKLSPTVTAASLEYVDSQIDGQDGVEDLRGTRSVATSPDGNFVYAVANNDDSVVVFQRDGSSGQLSFLTSYTDGQEIGSTTITGLNGARDVQISPDGNHLYVASFFADAVAVFSRDLITGELTFVQSIDTDDLQTDSLNGATSLTISPDGENVYVASSLGDAVVVFQRNAVTGELTFVADYFDTDSGIDGLDGAQDIIISPDSQHVYLAGTNDNALVLFQRNPTSGRLIFQEILQDDGFNRGLAIIRGIAISSDGKSVYAVSEQNSELAHYSRDFSSGKLTFQQVLVNGQDGILGLSGAQDVVVSPDGQSVVVASADDNAVVLFSRHQGTGDLTIADRLDGDTGLSGLSGAWSVAISPDSEEVYIASLLDHAITTAHLDLGATVISLSDGEVAASQNFGIGNLKPTVTEVFVNSTDWTQMFADNLNGNENLGFGYSIPVGSSQQMDNIPFGAIDQIKIRFSESVTVTLEDLSMHGVKQYEYSFTSFEYDDITNIATWNLSQPITEDRLQFQLAAATVVDEVGSVLDGEWVDNSSVFPSGDGSEGGDFLFQFSLLQGDVNNDDIVDQLDLDVVIKNNFSLIGSVRYDPLFDINGDGLVSLRDLLLVRNLRGAQLDQTLASEPNLLPKVAGVLLANSFWSESQLSAANTSTTAAQGIMIPSGSESQLTPIKRQGLNRLSISFTEEVNITAADFQLFDSDENIIVFSDFSYDPITATASWTLPLPLAIGSYRIEISDQFQDLSSRQFDGEWVAQQTSYPSGDDEPGGLFSFSFAVTHLSGDVNEDGIINAKDMQGTIAAMFSLFGSSRYQQAADLDQDGVIGLRDLLMMRNMMSDLVPPKVSNVQIASESWTTAFTDYLVSENLGDELGYSIAVGSPLQSQVIPFVDINQLTISFTEDVNINLESLLITVDQEPVEVIAFQYNEATYQATWIFTQPLGGGEVQIKLDDSIDDLFGNLLAGNWTNEVSVFPSGDNAAGGDFEFTINLHPGNLNGDERVDRDDLAVSISQQFSVAGVNTRYSVFGDINGDGIISIRDLLQVRNLITDKIPPKVSSLQIGSSGWTTAFTDYLDIENFGDSLGVRLQVGTAEQIQSITYAGIDQLTISFTEDVIVQSSDLVIEVEHLAISYQSFVYDSETFKATWFFSEPLANGAVELRLSDHVHDSTGNIFDGEWTNGISLYPSGDGQAGGDFQFLFNVLPGDLNADGVVDSSDLAVAITQQFTVAGNSPRYRIEGDFNGDGIISLRDLLFIRNARTETSVSSPNAEGSSAPSALIVEVTDVVFDQGASKQSENRSVSVSRRPKIFSAHKIGDTETIEFRKDNSIDVHHFTRIHRRTSRAMKVAQHEAVDRFFSELR